MLLTGFDVVAKLRLETKYLQGFAITLRDIFEHKGAIRYDAHARGVNAIRSNLFFHDKRSTVSTVDGLRYNQTIGYPYISRLYEMACILMHGYSKKVFTEREITVWYHKILKAHYANILYEIENPCIDYSKPVHKVKKLPKARAEAKEKAAPKARRTAKKEFKVNFKKGGFMINATKGKIGGDSNG